MVNSLFPEAAKLALKIPYGMALAVFAFQDFS
jgi:hypothetical protein